MEPLRDAHIVRLIEQLGEHYRANISNHFIRPALLQISLEKSAWDQLEILTEKNEQYAYQGFYLDELYQQISAATQFVVTVRREAAPALRLRMGSSSGGPDKILREMAINNFPANLQIFIDLLIELFNSLVEIDKATAKGHRPLYQQVPELANIGRRLTSG